ncbi:MAG: NAD(P)H-dependent glycerol-3-phosphate dehydrogenase [Devosia sp.]
MAISRVAVIGAGEWGTALAQAAAVAGRQVSLVGRNMEVLGEINRTHTNSRYLGPLQLSPHVSATNRYSGADLIILAVPAQMTRAALMDLGGISEPVVLSAKGLEHATLMRQSEVLADVAPNAIPFVLSGPSFAKDVAAGRPTAVSLAGDDERLTAEVATALAGPTFRPYATSDRIGVELAGALKNVYALAAGAVDGARLGASARAGVIARGFAEMSRIVLRLGGHASSLTGLAGLGDLSLSCTTEQSRNYRHGVALGKGLAPTGELAEGVFTAPVAQMLARRAEVDAPLIDAVNLLLKGSQSIERIVAGLMSRPLKRED